MAIFLTYMNESFETLTQSFEEIMEAMGSSQRFFDVLKREPAVNFDGGRRLPGAGRISWPDEPEPGKDEQMQENEHHKRHKTRTKNKSHMPPIMEVRRLFHQYLLERYTTHMRDEHNTVPIRHLCVPFGSRLRYPEQPQPEPPPRCKVCGNGKRRVRKEHRFQVDEPIVRPGRRVGLCTIPVKGGMHHSRRNSYTTPLSPFGSPALPIG